jgi:hypothetical protein
MIKRNSKPYYIYHIPVIKLNFSSKLNCSAYFLLNLRILGLTMYVVFVLQFLHSKVSVQSLCL